MLLKNRHRGVTSSATHRSVLKCCCLSPGPSQTQHQLPWALHLPVWEECCGKACPLCLLPQPLPLSFDPAGVALYSVLSAVLHFPMCCISELCNPFVASTLQVHPSAVALVSPQNISMLSPWNVVQLSCRWLLCSYYLPVLMISFLKTYFCHISSRKYHPSTHPFKRKARRR